MIANNSKDLKLLEDLRNVIMETLMGDEKPMTSSVLMFKVFRSMQKIYPSKYISQKDFQDQLSFLVAKSWVGRNVYAKYFVDYLDYPETDVSGEGYLEINCMTGHGFITVKRNFREYKNPSHFVHRKNLNGAKCGDYVKFQELEITHPKKDNFSFKDAIVKGVLPRPIISV